MKHPALRLLLGAVILWTGLCPGTALAAKPNQLTRAEKKAGWVLLFDGKTLDGWKGFKTNSPPANWKVQDGCLHNNPTGKGGKELLSLAQYDQFELSWEWKVGPRGNSGLKYFVIETRKSPIGHEYQMVDDGHFETNPIGSTIHGTGSFYDVLAPSGAEPKIGEFNQSRILVRGQHVEHWLNGKKVLEYELGSEVVKAAVAKSKFKAMEGFGTQIKGHILLQDHGDEVWFRNVKIRPLSSL